MEEKIKRKIQKIKIKEKCIGKNWSTKFIGKIWRKENGRKMKDQKKIYLHGKMDEEEINRRMEPKIIGKKWIKIQQRKWPAFYFHRKWNEKSKEKMEENVKGK